MNQPTPSRPCYKHKPIQSMAALARALAVPESLLHDLSETADSRYCLASTVEKPDGSIRQTFDALPALKDVHRRIKTQILSRVEFPAYLTGSVKGQDYKTNAALHMSSRILICEDISNFFPATTSAIVLNIWRHFFEFSDEVAVCLTKLTTKDDTLPQGAITSSYLANLAFWQDEPKVQAHFARKGLTYSRYVDDIAVSAKRFIAAEEKTAIVATIYRMLGRLGFKAKRKKHELHTSKGRMTVTKLVVNAKPALAKENRAAIRAAVYQLEEQARNGNQSKTLSKNYHTVQGRVATLGRFHGREAAQLKKRMHALKPFLLANKGPGI